MLLNNKIKKAVDAHPKLVTLGVGLGIAITISIVISSLSIDNAHALLHSGPACIKC